MIHQKCLPSYKGLQHAVRYQVTLWMQSTKHWHRKELSKKVQEVHLKVHTKQTEIWSQPHIWTSYQNMCQIEKYLQKRRERKAVYRVKAWNQNHEQRGGNGHWFHNGRESVRPEQNYVKEMCSSGPQDFTVSPRHCRRCKDVVSTQVMIVHKEMKRIIADCHIP